MPRLNADLPVAMLAMGWYYSVCCRDYDRALEDILPVVERQPNVYFTVLAVGGIRKRQGNFEQAARLYTRADGRESVVGLYGEAIEGLFDLLANRLRYVTELERFAAPEHHFRHLDVYVVLHPRGDYPLDWHRTEACVTCVASNEPTYAVQPHLWKVADADECPPSVNPAARTFAAQAYALKLPRWLTA